MFSENDWRIDKMFLPELYNEWKWMVYHLRSNIKNFICIKLRTRNRILNDQTNVRFDVIQDSDK